MAVTILDPHLGDTYEYDYFDFPINLISDELNGTVETIDIVEIDANDPELIYELGFTPSISNKFTNVFDQQFFNSFRQETDYKNVITTVNSFEDIPEKDIHITKFQVDPRRTKDQYFEVFYIERYEDEIDPEIIIEVYDSIMVYSTVYNSFDRKRDLFLAKLNEIESRGPDYPLKGS